MWDLRIERIINIGNVSYGIVVGELEMGRGRRLSLGVCCLFY